MTITEKNVLGSKIRMLSQDQMKGIINILSDQYCIENNSKFFEFDIDALSNKKLRELEKYVKKCLKTPVNLVSKPSNQNQRKNDNDITDLKNNLNPKINTPASEKASIDTSKLSQVQQLPEKQIFKQPNQQQQQQATNKPLPVHQNDMKSPLDSLSSSDEDDSGSLSSLDFKKGH
jgi:hypothetical protein